MTLKHIVPSVNTNNEAIVTKDGRSLIKAETKVG